ncbi:MAG: hypothetical protein MRQ07_02925 [Candidatus Midichloria sp.]|nr:hypothetical protein [Candidatus Midichloria sp.]
MEDVSDDIESDYPWLNKPDPLQMASFYLSLAHDITRNGRTLVKEKIGSAKLRSWI